jgi:hypothetical protein
LGTVRLDKFISVFPFFFYKKGIILIYGSKAPVMFVGDL